MDLTGNDTDMVTQTPITLTHAGRRALGAVAFALGLLLLAQPGFAQPKDAPVSFADLADKLLPAVVNISTTQVVENEPGPQFRFPPGSPFEDLFRDYLERRRDQGENRRRRATALGSGFIISADGYVVTNNHVIAEADEISVRLQDGSTLEAKVIGRDPKVDLALLKVEPTEELPFVSFGDSRVTRVGDWVLAIGNPFGLGGSVTAGIVSARGRNINQGPYDDFIQTDASINRGNSGGPMFNLDGEVVGINTAIFSPTGGSVGIGFAIPSSIAENVIDQLRKYGRTRRGWLGVHIQTVTDEIAESVGLDMARGAMVSNVAEDGPAEAAGIRQGDVILSFDGKPIESMRMLPRVVAETDIGKDVAVEVWRDGALSTLKVNIGELNEEQVAASETRPERETARRTAEADIDALGITVASINDRLRQRFNLADSAEGVVITDVAGDSHAAEKGVRPGDVILEVSHEPVTNAGEVLEKVETAAADDKRTVLLLIETSAGPRYFGLLINRG